MALFAERVRKALGDLVFHIGNVRGSNIEEEKHGKGRNDGDAGKGGERRQSSSSQRGGRGGEGSEIQSKSELRTNKENV